jgi:hypothetical protein
MSAVLVVDRSALLAVLFTESAMIRVPATHTVYRRLKAIAGKLHTRSRRIFVRLQGAAAGASPGYVTAGVTPKAGERTSEMLWDLTEIA